MLWPLIGDVQRAAPLGCHNVKVMDSCLDCDSVV